MRNLIEEFRNIYDYVIIDLPPIGEVSDSLAVADYVDGMLLVVRQNYCNRVALADAISQFEFVNTKLIGIALNCSNDDVDGYGRYKYARYGKYRRYYKYRRYGYGSYRRAYLATMKKAKEQKAEGAENE
jgi:Mrp family chromosome partitioning ATPase